jgi:heptosyltransferase-2
LKKILIIQTAFIGDVVLATGILEKLHQAYPEAAIDFMLRKGNEGLLANHPFVNRLLVWNKKEGKYKNLFGLLKEIRKEKYDLVINLQRFAASGILTTLSKAKVTIGFKKNPFSFLFTKAYPHEIGHKGQKQYLHEVQRNHQLIADITDDQYALPKLYPSLQDFESVKSYKSKPYITIAPASVWFTKQYPKEKWTELLDALPPEYTVYCLGGPGDVNLCTEIVSQSKRKDTVILAGKLSFLQTAALMKDVVMNYTNDSAPMHFASAMQAPVAAIFCSTIPEFGFGPLSVQSNIVEIIEPLECRPCGLHGYKACPLGHFKCAWNIRVEQLLAPLDHVKH